MAEVNGSDHEAAPHGLFSMVASDNAEVIPPSPPRGPETMWSVAANADGDPDGFDVDGSDTPTGDVWNDAESFEDHDASADPPPFTDWESNGNFQDTASGPFRRGPVDPLGSVFSAEPVDHLGDVVDEAELLEDTAWAPPPGPAAEGSLFSNGSHLQTPPETRRRPAPGPVAGSARPSAGAAQDPWIITDRSWDDPRSDQEPWAPDTAQGGGPHGPHAQEFGSRSPGRSTGLVVDDSQGFETAILRLHPQDRERAHVPLSVCGALLREDEVVLGAVTGQMLGRPAAVVVTEERVLVVNDRRWQPVVDIFPIDGDLVVRGRHDRQVAALSFADPTRVSMVDGIGEVGIAIELADHIRDAGPRGGG